MDVFPIQMGQQYSIIDRDGLLAEYMSGTANDAEGTPAFLVDVGSMQGPGEIALKGESDNPVFLSIGLFRYSVMSWCLDKMSASVLPVMKVTSHTLAQEAMSMRSLEREEGTVARAPTEGMVAERVLSSAKTSRLLETTSNRSLLKTKNRSGASTLPCGTPARMGRKDEPASPTATFCERSDRKLQSHVRRGPDTQVLRVCATA